MKCVSKKKYLVSCYFLNTNTELLESAVHIGCKKDMFCFLESVMYFRNTLIVIIADEKIKLNEEKRQH